MYLSPSEPYGVSVGSRFLVGKLFRLNILKVFSAPTPPSVTKVVGSVKFKIVHLFLGSLRFAGF